MTTRPRRKPGPRSLKSASLRARLILGEALSTTLVYILEVKLDLDLWANTCIRPMGMP